MTENLQQEDEKEQNLQTESPVKQRRKGIYILPNLFTLAALFGGFYAIVMAYNGEYTKAAIGIFCAMILDGFDGRVARLTGTASEFGEQFDSLSDMVSFGAAPALVIYVWALEGLGKIGWLVAFVYCACGALRLARFNTNIAVVDKRFFQGLPSPAAAGIVASFVALMADYGFKGQSLPWIALFMTLFAGLSMVSNIPFYSFKVLNVRASVSFFKVVFFALGFAALLAMFAYKSAQTMFLIFICYGISGYIIYARNWFKGDKVKLVKSSSPADETSSTPPEEKKD